MRAAASIIFLFMFAATTCSSTEQSSIFSVLEMPLFNGTVARGGDNFDGCNTTYTESSARTWYPGRCGVGGAHLIAATINITGYRGVVILDGNEYLSGCPADLAIISQSVETSHAGFEANKDWVQRTTTVVSSGGSTTATLEVVFLWHWTTHSSITGANRKHYRVSTKTVSVTKPHPKIIEENISNTIIAEITQYNNTFDPYTIIHVDTPKNIVSVSYLYKNITAKRFNSVGRVTDAGVDYIDAKIWKTTPHQDMVFSCGNACLIKESPLDMSRLQIQITSPHETENITRCNITTITSTPAGYVNFKTIIMYVSVLMVLGMCVWLNVRRFQS